MTAKAATFARDRSWLRLAPNRPLRLVQIAAFWRATLGVISTSESLLEMEKCRAPFSMARKERNPEKMSNGLEGCLSPRI
jgi:hypothetical protein